MIPLRRAIFYILLAVLTVSGTCAVALGYIQYIRQKRIQDSHFKIVAIAQCCSEKEALPTAYLAELMELSTDQPVNLYQIKTTELERRLGRSALIKQAKVNKVSPGIVFVDYILRKPIAFLGDFSNTALDREGVLIPFKPYFTPKNLPTLYLGLNEDECGTWGKALQGGRAELALQLLQLLSAYCCNEQTQLMRIDVSKALALSYGQRQIVILLEERNEHENKMYVYPRLLRLSPDNYRQELANYLVLRTHIDPYPEQGLIAPLAIFEMRIPHLAFVKTDASK